MEGIAHFRRRKCIVLNLNPTKTTKGDDDKRMQFSVNGIHMDLAHGQEVDLLEPVYNTLKSNVRIDHVLTTIVDPNTGEVTHKDSPKEHRQYSVTELGEWFWPKDHSPWDADNNLIRHDLTEEELAKSPRHPLWVEKNPVELKEEIKEEMAV